MTWADQEAKTKNKTRNSVFLVYIPELDSEISCFFFC